MVSKRKTWTEKLHDSKDLPKVVRIEGKMVSRWGEGTVAIPSPMEVNELMSLVPEGRVTTINEIRQALAKRHGATIGCPITTGIFAWVAANAAEEAKQKGASESIPYWRTLKSGGAINEKYPGGVESQKRLLEAEGHSVVKKGKNQVIQCFESKLFNF